MANDLDELTGPVNENGRDVNVIQKQLEVKTGVGSVIFEILLWVLFIVPGVVFLFKKEKAKNYFKKLEQKIQHDASQIDNYLEQRVVILKNVAKLVDKAIQLDKDTFTEIAKLRSGNPEAVNEEAEQIERVNRKINVQLEAYPELQAHKEISDALQQNSYLQREITAAREVYNDSINEWNRSLYEWPTKKIVASRMHLTTKIPFSVSKEVKEEARGTFF